MRNFLLLSLCAALFASCGNDKAAVQPEPAVQVKSAAAVVDPVTQKLETLKKTEQLDLDKMASFLPNKLNGIRRTSIHSASDHGYGRVHADYEKDAKSDIRVTLYDCAGKDGANLYSTTYQSRLGFRQENADGYTKTVDLFGTKAIEGLDSATRVSMLTFLAGDRVLVVMTGRNIKPDDLKKAAEAIAVK